MMDKANGLSNKAHFWRELSSDTDFEYSDPYDEFSPFRGFEKEPTVVIEKIDIKPFIKKQISESKQVQNKPLSGIRKTLPQLVSSCYVKLVRDDLKLLKERVLENCRLNKSKTNGILSMPFLHCKICEKAYESEKKLQNHMENKHMLVYKAGFSRKPQKRVSFSDHVVVHELKEYHRCRKCTRIFEEYQSLKTHMKQEHRKRKCYICHYCSKNFVDRMFFKVHIKLHCDICGLFFPNKRMYLRHRRETCRVKKKYTCKTCQNLFFSYMDLKDHSYDHLEDLFICDICKDQHSTKCAVSHHILFLHSKKRLKELYSNRNLGNERLYLCNFCDVSSIDRNVIDKHVSILPDLNNRKRTGYKDYYFCDQCSRKFDTETNMLQHKWSHFLNTSEISQVRSDNKMHTTSIESKDRNEIRRIFKIYEKLPDLMQPKIVLERIHYVKPQNRIATANSYTLNTDLRDKREGRRKRDRLENVTEKKVGVDLKSKKVVEGIVNSKLQEDVPSIVEKEVINQEKVSPITENRISDLTYHNEVNVIVKKAIVDPKSKKTLISRFQCEKCNKYYSSNYCLNRHMLSMHQDYANLRCNVCEESFVWPSLLKSHNCIRTNIPEMPFDDVRPEIQFDSYRDLSQAGFDELMNISESEDYMNSVDFEIPAPIVELTEYENGVVNLNGNCIIQNGNYGVPVHNSYKIVMQEVPIEF